MSSSQQAVAERVELFVLLTTSAAAALPVVTIGAGLAPANGMFARFPVPIGIAIALSLALSVCNWVVVRRSVNAVIQGTRGRWSMPFLLVWVAVAAALLATIATIPDPSAWLCAGVSMMSVPISLVPVLRASQAGWASGAYLAFSGLLLLVAPDLALPILLAFACICVGLWGTWWTVWMLRMQLELVRAGRDRAALALAEERLRIARDLHDVFGRTLATIAVKGELAQALIDRDRGALAATELAQITLLTREAGVEVRRVIRGELETTWDAEVAGARSLLLAAGIDCVVQGGPPSDAADVFAWVVREGVTNVIRHSRATRVTISTSTDAATGEARLAVSNDGAALVRASVHDPSTGTGLDAMSARISARGGRIRTRRDGDRFLLEAALPLGTASGSES